MAELVEIPLASLDDHPQNPRLVYRSDVIDSIVANLDDNWPRQHALHVRPTGDRYQIIAGHTRKRAAEKRGIKKVWCWVEKLNDDDAFMQLVTSNSQGELSPLEIGIHALRAVPKAEGGRGKKGGLSEYAERIGRHKTTIGDWIKAAEVYDQTNCRNVPTVYPWIERTFHLATIHRLPRACWPAACGWLAEHDIPVQAVESKVEITLRFLEEFKPAKRWAEKYLPAFACADAVFKGQRGTEFNLLASLANEVLGALSGHDDLQENWAQWLEENTGGDSWDIRKTQAKRIELDTIRLEREAEPPIETVSVLLADPPWQYDFAETENRKIENQYPTAPVDEICDHLDIERNLKLADDAVLFLWATAPKLREALKVMEAWGFEYKTHAVWDKEKIGMGYWFRGQHELLLVGTRGDFSPPDSSCRFASVFREERRRHSEKPDCVYAAIEEMFPEAKRYEMYQRKPRKGWQGGGNEAR